MFYACAQPIILELFLPKVYVNDMPNVFLHTIPFMFADDTKCLKRIKEPADSFALQLDLDNLSDWSKAFNLSFNQNKFVHLHFGVILHHLILILVFKTISLMEQKLLSTILLKILD